jgi:hypothetical protein
VKKTGKVLAPVLALLLVFVLCSGIALMLFGLIANFFGGGEDDE